MGKQHQTTAKAPATRQAPKKSASESNVLLFGKDNYVWMLIGIAIIVIGFALMSGGAVDDPNKFNYDLFSFRRIILAPIVVIGGFVFEIFAIMKKHPEE